MRLLCFSLPALCAITTAHVAFAQSTMMTALDASVPAPTIERTTAALTRGLAGVWTDPTVDVYATGAFFSIERASYTSITVVHAAAGFRLGPRWSVALATAGLGDLFDSALTNQDPGLSSLRSQVAWGRMDATWAFPRFAASVGLSVVGDDDVGVVQSSTLARAHLRLRPFRNDRVSIGLRSARSIGGSVPVRSSGQHSLDVTIRRQFGASSIGLTVAGSEGGLWRHAETSAAYGIATQLTLRSLFDIGMGITRYSTNYGASAETWSRSITAGIQLGMLRLSTRYASTQLGTGSGFAVYLGYERTAHPQK